MFEVKTSICNSLLFENKILAKVTFYFKLDEKHVRIIIVYNVLNSFYNIREPIYFSIIKGSS